jgi:HEAT repeat protein
MLWWTLRQLRASDPDRRAEAARKAGESGNNAAVPKLAEALDDEDSTVRAAAADALGCLGDVRAIEPLSRLLSSRIRSARHRHAAGGDDRRAAVDALSKFGDSAVDPLVAALQTDDRDLRKAVVVALGELGCARAAGALIDRLADARSEVRKAAAHALAALGGREALEGLASAIGHRDAETRRSAAEALGHVGGNEVVEPLLRAVADSDENVQLAAIAALRSVGGVGAAVALKPALESGKRAVRAAAAAALRSMPLEAATPEDRAAIAVLKGDYPSAVREGAAAITPLVDALGSSSPECRRLAADALSQLNAPRAAPALVRLLRDHDEAVSRAAAWALSTTGPEAVPLLIEALSFHDGRAQLLAAEALGRICDIHAVRALSDTIVRNSEASAEYPAPLDAARAARDALVAILSASAGAIPQGELDLLASAPDGACIHQDADGQVFTRDVVVDCRGVRDRAEAERARRHAVSGGRGV